jgi:hypothetical protein
MPTLKAAETAMKLATSGDRSKEVRKPSTPVNVMSSQWIQAIKVLRECKRCALINGTNYSMSTQNVVQTGVKLVIFWGSVKKPSTPINFTSSQ